MPPLVPEFYVSDLARSLAFYRDVLGFRVAYERPDERFAYLTRDGAELMLEEPLGRLFLAGPLEHPFGRGMHLQIRVRDANGLYLRCLSAEAPVLLSLEVKWYTRGDTRVGNRQFVVSDPDGYVLRLAEDLGERRA